jgi:hypothetical protein
MDKYDECNTSDQLLRTVDVRFTKYYRDKINCVLDYCFEGNWTWNMKFISEVALNRYDPSQRLSEQPTEDFIKSGLFHRYMNIYSKIHISYKSI